MGVNKGRFGKKRRSADVLFFFITQTLPNMVNEMTLHAIKVISYGSRRIVQANSCFRHIQIKY